MEIYTPMIKKSKTLFNFKSSQLIYRIIRPTGVLMSSPILLILLQFLVNVNMDWLTYNIFYKLLLWIIKSIYLPDMMWTFQHTILGKKPQQIIFIVHVILTHKMKSIVKIPLSKMRLKSCLKS